MKKCLYALLCAAMLASLVGCKAQITEASSVNAQTDKENNEEPETVAEIGAAADIPIVSSTGTDYTSVLDLYAEPGTYIAFVGQSSKTGYWQKIKQGVTQAVDDLNESLGYTGSDKITITFDAPDSAGDISAQINIVDEMINKNPDVLCLSAIDYNSFRTQLVMAEENAIDVIGFDSGVSGDSFDVFCGTDNYEAGVLAARQLCELIDDQGQAAVLVHSRNSKSGLEREAGFIDEIEENHPGVELVMIADVSASEAKGSELVSSIIHVFPEIKAFFGTNEETGKYILEGCKNSGRDELVKVCFDAGSGLLDGIEKGTLSGTIVQNLYGMGYASVVAAVREMQGLSNEEFVNTGYQWIDSTNVDQESLQMWLYQ